MKIAEDCRKKKKGKDWCRLSADCEGWKCRCLSCIPDKVPVTEQEKGRLFVKVYKMAEDTGVLQCPYFTESSIDITLDNPELMSRIVTYGSSFRTVLLSESEIHNNSRH